MPLHRLLSEQDISVVVEQETGVRLEAKAVAPEATPEITDSQRKLDILVAEDNKTNRFVVKKILQSQNVLLRFSHDGQEDVSAYKERVPDLILMDVSMPIMDGLAATKAIRDVESTLGISRCPIIALTANAMSGDRENCLAAGMDDYLSKPLNRKALLNKLAKWGEQVPQGLRNVASIV
ncbi:MAG: response regulator [Pseudomonadota bacterium]